MMAFKRNLLAEPWAVVLVSEVFGVSCCFALSGVAGSLLKMHRSKTKVKKLRKTYRFGQRLLVLLDLPVLVLDIICSSPIPSAAGMATALMPAITRKITAV